MASPISRFHPGNQIWWVGEVSGGRNIMHLLCFRMFEKFYKSLTTAVLTVPYHLPSKCGTGCQADLRWCGHFDWLYPSSKARSSGVGRAQPFVAELLKSASGQ